MKKKEELLLNFGYYGVLILLSIVIIYIAFTWLLPVCMSLLVTFALQPLIANIVKALHIKKQYSFFIISILVYILIIGLVLYLCFLGILQIYALFEKIPSYIESIFTFIKNNPRFQYLHHITSYFHESINQMIQNSSITFMNYIIVILKKIPSLAFDIMFIIMSSLFFILDYKNLRHRILTYTKKEKYVLQIISCIKETISSAFKAYLFIFIITFIELLVGFYIIGLEDVVMLAFCIALFDFFPILGFDMIFIPWIVILAFQNQVVLAVHLLIVYIIIIISKNILEPKLLSKHMGIHPLVTIVSMFIGVTFLGIIGMVFVPLLVTMMKRIYDLHREVKNE